MTRMLVVSQYNYPTTTALASLGDKTQIEIILIWITSPMVDYDIILEVFEVNNICVMWLKTGSPHTKCSYMARILSLHYSLGFLP
jgi:hypothetical protein